MKKWPLHKASFWEQAPFFRALLPLAAGILCYYQGWLPWWSESILLSAVLISFVGYVVAVYKVKTIKALTFALLQVALFFSGAAIAYNYDIRNDKQWFAKELALQKNFLVLITTEPSEKKSTWKIPVDILYAADTVGNISRATGKAFLYLYKDQRPMLFHKGDSLWVPGRWQRVTNYKGGTFDYARYCARNNIYHQQLCNSNDVRLYATHDAAQEPCTVQVHNWCMDQLDRYIADHTTKGLIQAMLLGDEVNLDEDLRQQYADTGIIHIIAISGGNVAIFFLVISFLLSWLKNKKHVWVKYLVALPFIWSYVLMAGAAPSAIRAAAMFSLLALSILLRQNNNNLNTLLATAFFLLCAQPAWLFSLGFQLSFIAVLSLILFYSLMYRWVAPVHKIARWLWSAIAASIAAELLVAPLVIYYFHSFPLLFAVANAAALLFMGVVLILGIGVVAFSMIPAAAKTLAWLTTILVTYFGKIVTVLQQCNPAAFYRLHLTGIELCMVYIVIAGLATFFIKKKKPALFAGLLAAGVLLLLLCNDEWQELHQRNRSTERTSFSSLRIPDMASTRNTSDSIGMIAPIQ